MKIKMKNVTSAKTDIKTVWPAPPKQTFSKAPKAKKFMPHTTKAASSVKKMKKIPTMESAGYVV
jgi:hypothetical protein